MTDIDEDQSFCGCCGREILGPNVWWCSECTAHVTWEGPPWERTYFAQHGVECPHQVGMESEP